jgi:hypothetical protein
MYGWGTNVPGPPGAWFGHGLCTAGGVVIHTGYIPSPVIAGRGFTGEPGEPRPGEPGARVLAETRKRVSNPRHGR